MFFVMCLIVFFWFSFSDWICFIRLVMLFMFSNLEIKFLGMKCFKFSMCFLVLIKIMGVWVVVMVEIVLLLVVWLLVFVMMMVLKLVVFLKVMVCFLVCCFMFELSIMMVLFGLMVFWMFIIF